MQNYSKVPEVSSQPLKQKEDSITVCQIFVFKDWSLMLIHAPKEACILYHTEPRAIGNYELNRRFTKSNLSSLFLVSGVSSDNCIPP